MGLVTNRVCSLLLAAVLTSSLAAEQPRAEDSRWSRRISDQRTSNDGSEWIPLSAPCPSCQPNDRVSSGSDEVASLLTPPLPDYPQAPSFLPPKQFREQLRPTAQQLVRQPNGHQQFIPPTQQFPPKFALLPEPQLNDAKKPDAQKPFVQTPSPQFVQQPNGGAQLPILQHNSRLPTDGLNQFIPPPPQQQFVLPQASFPQLIAQDSRIQYNTDPNQIQNSQYQQFIGQFFQPQQLSFAPQTFNESEASSLSDEEKPEVQLVYVPVEALNQRGRFNIPYKTGTNTLTELKGDLQLQQEPSALAAEESRQQRQSFQTYFEQQQPTSQPQTHIPNPTFSPQLVLPSEQPRQNQAIEPNHHQILQGQRTQLSGVPQQIQSQNGQQSLGQQLVQSLRAHPTGIPQQLPHHQPSDQLAAPIQGTLSTRAPQLQRQPQIQHDPLVNQEHFLQYLRPLPTIASQLLQQQQEQIQEQQPSPSPRPHSTQIPQLQLQQSSLEGQFLQTRQPHHAQAQQHVTEQPQLSEPKLLQTQRPRVLQPHRQATTQPSTQQPPVETQRPLPSTKAPQPQKVETTLHQQSTTAKPVPHQPPLSVYMGREGHDIKIADVIKVLKNAKTIAVLDSVGPESPQVFVGPSNLKPPLSYAKFELPYLSSIESNRVERKVDQLPFFVAPLNFNPPPGYSKIPFPAPHIGSVVVSNPADRDPTNGKENVELPTVKPARGRFSSQYSLPADLPAINPQLPSLVNSLQDSSRQQGNAFLAPTREQAIAPTRRPHHQAPAQHLQQVPHQQPIQQFHQEVHQVSEAPETTHFPQTHHTPQLNQFSNFQHVTTTPRTQHFSGNPPLEQHEQFSQAPPTPHFVQAVPTTPAPQPSQFPQFGHFPTHTRLVSPNQVTQAPETPQFQQFPEFTQVQQTPRTQQFHHESTLVPQAPEVQQYQREQETPQQQAHVPVETEAPQQELPTTPLPRIPKRRPAYRGRQRTTEASTTDEPSTTTRRPYTRGRRPFTTRHRVQQQETESQQDIASTTQHQFQEDAEPSSTTEYFTGFKYSTRTPARAQVDIRAQNTRTLAQEDPPKRNNVPRTRTRTRERNSHRVTGQNVPSYRTQVVENQASNVNIQDEQDTVVPPHESRRQQPLYNEQDTVVPPHESRRQQPLYNQNYNTERSGFEEPTTENNRFEQVNSNFPQQNTQNDEITYQQQLGLQFQNSLSVSPTRQPLTDYQTTETFFPVPSTSQPDEVPFQEIYHPVSSTTAHPEVNSYVPNQPPPSADHHRTRGHPQLVNELPLNLPQFTLPVQVSVSGQTEKPEVEETPRPVYVRIRGQTRGRRPQAQGAAGVQRPVPQYQQQQETSETLQKIVPQDQRLVYQNQLRRPSSDAVQQAQLPVVRQRVPQDNFKVAPSKQEESEENYGFIRPVSFPPSTVNQDESSLPSREPNSFEETQSQESQESPASLEDLSQNIPVNRVRQNFLGRQNRRPVALTEEATTPITTVYTVRPSRRQQPVKQQVRITSIRGRMRRPTSSTTELSEPSIPEHQPTSTESQFVRRRPTNRFAPSLNSNEVTGESQESIATPRSSLQRYETPSRGASALRRPVVTNEDHDNAGAPSTPSTFQITLLDEAPNYPVVYNEQLRGQHNFNYHLGRPQDLSSLNSENFPRYPNEDPEGGAESQWATKRLPFVYSGQDGSTIALISFTTELPNVEQTVTEIPLVATKENLTNEANVENSNNTLSIYQEAEQPTTEYPTDLTSQAIYAEEEDKTFSKDQKEVFSAQKKAGDHNLEKKNSSGRRGTWVRVRKVQRPHDSLETAESQNIGALSKNQLQAMASKGSFMNSWPLPPPSLVLDETVFDVPKISPAESYITVDESADDVLVKSTFVENDGFDKGQTFGSNDKSVGEGVATTTEGTVVTEQYRNEEATTVYITPRPAEEATTSKKVVQEIVHITTDSPVFETSTQQHLDEVKSSEVNITQSNPTNDEIVEVSEQINQEAFDSFGDKVNEEAKDKTAETVEGSEEKNSEDSNDETVEVTTTPTSNESVKFVEATTEAEVKHQTTESAIEQLRDNANEETVERTNVESKGLAHEERLLIQSSVRDAIQQNTPTEGNTEEPGILQVIEELFNETATTTDVSPADADTPDEIVRTSMRTEVSHETEICFRGRCVKTKSTDNDHLVE